MKDQKQSPKKQPKRGRPETRTVKIDDTPRNVARAFFGMRSTKYDKTPRSK